MVPRFFHSLLQGEWEKIKTRITVNLWSPTFLCRCRCVLDLIITFMLPNLWFSCRGLCRFGTAAICHARWESWRCFKRSWLRKVFCFISADATSVSFSDPFRGSRKPVQTERTSTFSHINNRLKFHTPKIAFSLVKQQKKKTAESNKKFHENAPPWVEKSVWSEQRVSLFSFNFNLNTK